MTNEKEKNVEASIISQKDTPEQDQKVAITIAGSFKEVKEEIDSIPKGKYLYIETNLKSEPIYIPLEEFSNLISRAKTKPKTNVPSSDSQVGTEDDTPIERIGQKPDFKELMSFLLQKIDISFENHDNEVVILSDAGIFLELPWEDIANKKIYVFRKVPNSKAGGRVKTENNLLLLLSHAHENIGENLKKKMDEEIKGIFALVNSVLENEQQSFRMEKVLFSKHTTKKSLESINWEEYNYAHLVMHGLPDGKLCLENPDKTKYKQPDFMSASEFLNILKEKNLSLIFLSFCFSGGGLDGDEESLALGLVKNSASKYVIGYRYPVGDSSAASFAKTFYEHLINGDEIERVYKSSLESYYEKSGTKEYIPLLYMRE